MYTDGVQNNEAGDNQHNGENYGDGGVDMLRLFMFTLSTAAGHAKSVCWSTHIPRVQLHALSSTR